MKNIRVFHLKKRTKKQQQQFLEVKLSIFLNRRVFVMRGVGLNTSYSTSLPYCLYSLVIYVKLI